jgi:hypothetical protein
LKIGYGLPAISIIGSWDGQPLRYVLASLPHALISCVGERRLT